MTFKRCGWVSKFRSSKSRFQNNRQKCPKSFPKFICLLYWSLFRHFQTQRQTLTLFCNQWEDTFVQRNRLRKVDLIDEKFFLWKSSTIISRSRLIWMIFILNKLLIKVYLNKTILFQWRCLDRFFWRKSQIFFGKD